VVEEQDAGARRPAEPVGLVDEMPHLRRRVLLAAEEAARERVDDDQARRGGPGRDLRDQPADLGRLEELDRLEDEMGIRPQAPGSLPRLDAGADAAGAFGEDVQHRPLADGPPVPRAPGRDRQGEVEGRDRLERARGCRHAGQRVLEQDAFDEGRRRLDGVQVVAADDAEAATWRRHLREDAESRVRVRCRGRTDIVGSGGRCPETRVIATAVVGVDVGQENVLHFAFPGQGQMPGHLGDTFIPSLRGPCGD
jgi:hypothetical protein